MGQVKGGVRMNTVIVNGINITEENERLKIELNELKRDVARYFYLENLPDDKHTIEVAIEHHALKEKLSKVGKE